MPRRFSVIVAIVFLPIWINGFALRYKARIASLFTRLHTTEERIERFIEVLYHGLQNVAMDGLCIGIGCLALFHLSQLLKLAVCFTALLLGGFSFSQTIFVEKATCFQSRIKQSGLGTTWVQAVEKGFARHG